MKKDLNKFIEECNKIHNNKYDYSKVNYINNKTKITIVCPIHGEFEQNAASHKSGHGCPKCSKQKDLNIDLEDIKNFREEYIKLIKNAKNNPPEVGELHHILPKSIFPKWEDRKSNLVKLSYQDHYKAHYLLFKIYNNKEMTTAFFLMFNSTNREFNPNIYEEVRKNRLTSLNRKVECVEDKIIFNSIKEAAERYKLKNSSSIIRACKNEKFTSCGKHWRYL